MPIVYEVMNKNKFKNLEIISANVSNRDLFKYASHCITCVSTIGLEFACFGKNQLYVEILTIVIWALLTEFCLKKIFQFIKRFTI